MHTEKLQLNDVRYNPALSAFEANVTLYERGEAYIYPCQMAAPMDAPFRALADGLCERALRQHKAARARALDLGALRMSRKSSATERAVHLIPAQSETPLYAA
ncbi:hypothetical protein [Litorivita sp. NS0012-18]|uniref:hypothetical protein n=1 Tax=Litorivita sp. NS0012-18 TaxID=3127655 RepID=UPI00310B5FC8